MGFSFQEFREKVNLRLYNSKLKTEQIFGYLSAAISFFAVGVIIYYYGYPQTEFSIKLNSWFLYGSLFFYIIRYLIRLFYDFHPFRFLKNNKTEGIILFSFFFFLIFQNSIIELTNQFVGHNIESYSILFIQFYILLIVFLKIGQSGSKISNLNLDPSTLLLLSFVVLILSGSGLLMLPEMTSHGISFVDALFTSTSASCVTGLVSVDTATAFTFKGKLVIMGLIQMGGISIVSFAAFFITFSQKSGGLKYQSLIKDFMSVDKLSDTRRILRNVIKFSIVIELIGAVLIFFSFHPDVPFKSTNDKIFVSVFHAVSAFNNAGFSTYTNNLYEAGVKNMYFMHMVIAALIFLGGIGFGVLQDIFSYDHIRERMKFRWKKLQIGTRISLRTSVFLIVFGAAAFWFFERNNVLSGQNFFVQVSHSVFQSVSTRTAGFNSVDFTKLGAPILVFMMFLMFVGAAPGGTGGGIKVTTFAVIVKSAAATITGKRGVDFFKRSVPFIIIDRAFSIALFSITIVFTSAFLLTITDPKIDFLKLLFEEVSAFGTVGLSTGITFNLSDASKLILITSMFVGRIGTLTLAMVLSRKVLSTKYQYAETNILVG
jgi:potassium uptake TrkH family protein